MREQFEKLPEIAELLIEAQFDEQTGEYVSYWSYKSGYLNGAYYAFQEQQKIINMQECGATEIRMILEDSEYNDSAKLERISELLE